jgi:hypothetical protein
MKPVEPHNPHQKFVGISFNLNLQPDANDSEVPLALRLNLTCEKVTAEADKIKSVLNTEIFNNQPDLKVDIAAIAPYSPRQYG